MGCEIQSRPGSVLVQKPFEHISALDSREFNWLTIFKSDPKILTEEKSWRTWKSNQNIVTDEELVHHIVTDEELVQNVVMDEKCGKNFVMGAKIDPKVEMGLSIFKIG